MGTLSIPYNDDILIDAAAAGGGIPPATRSEALRGRASVPRQGGRDRNDPETSVHGRAWAPRHPDHQP